MVWVLVALMLSGLVYVIAIVSEYKTYVVEIQPRIERTERQADKLGKGAEGEALLRDQTKARVAEIKAHTDELKLQVTDIQRQIAELEQAEEQLEMDKYKSDFKKSKRA
jgi:uncharacterized protein YukE